jgi:hypothetical protein
MDVALKATCFLHHGSSQQQKRLRVHACSFQVKDLIKVFSSAGIERLSMGRIPDSVYPQLGQGLSEKHPPLLKILQCKGK